MVDKSDQQLSIVQQCILLSLHRSGLYYAPSGESELNVELMRLMDEKYLTHPFYGARRMHQWLKYDKGYVVSLNRIKRLYYKVMGLRAIMPGPHTSKRAKGHKVYPYLLRELKVERSNQVWAIDITYIPMAKGFMYLVAIIDLNSRYVVGWSLSNTMDANWCAQVYRDAIRRHGKPEIINSDQGIQFTSDVFTAVSKQHGVKISMDGKGRAIDNVFIERLWRSVKYEYVYLNPSTDGVDLFDGIHKYFRYYNHKRRHQSLDYNPPATRYTRAA